ncbi:MAG TPA: hypothetical protein VNQ73_04160 [Ilumatobacter sp.]|nr:hypothetical protein [Ilumatobacter sp.]
MPSAALPLAPWRVVACNLPEHARNAIHTDAGAQAAGFPRALVAGVTTYAYLCHPLAAAWGLDWVAGGGAELSFVSPVFDNDLVECVIAGDDADIVEARVGGERRAAVRGLLVAPTFEFSAGGEPLPTLEVDLVGEFGADYATRAGDDLDLFASHGVVHPAVWVALANSVVHRNLVDGPWVHTRSTIAHHAAARAGGRAHVASRVIDRFERRSGERAVLAVEITVDNAPVATVEHEAIIRLT